VLLEPHYILVGLTNPHRIRAPTVGPGGERGDFNKAHLLTIICLNCIHSLSDPAEHQIRTRSSSHFGDVCRAQPARWTEEANTCTSQSRVIIV